MTSPPPLTNLRVLEFAGLAPGPFAGKLLADYGASVLRIDRPSSSASSDLLASRKRSLRVDLKSAPGISLILLLAQRSDILIDPFRPGVLEKLGLGPSVLLAANPRLIYARMAGFRRSGRYAAMAGHDINYIAVSGALAMLGRKDGTPYAPANILGDFAGGGMVCFVGVLLALLHRAATGMGQVVEANMVDGSAYLASFPRFAMLNPAAGRGGWTKGRGENLLDGGVPWYDTYRTRDGGFMAAGPLEPHFYATFLSLLLPAHTSKSIPDRDDRANWPVLKALFTETFLQKDRAEWERIFDGSDACVTPVKTYQELREEGFEHAPVVTLKESPALPAGEEAWTGAALAPGQGGREALQEWFMLEEGRHWMDVEEGATLVVGKAKL